MPRGRLKKTIREIHFPMFILPEMTTITLVFENLFHIEAKTSFEDGFENISLTCFVWKCKAEVYANFELLL